MGNVLLNTFDTSSKAVSHDMSVYTSYKNNSNCCDTLLQIIDAKMM